MPRKQGSPVAACLNLFKSNALGRLFTVNPRHTECFYLRLLLVNVTGPLSFQDIRKVNGQQYPTYKDACLALGLLEDDNQWECMLAEAALNCTAIQIRLLFAIVLTTCFPARAQILWENHKDSMTDDILHQHRIRCHDLTITFSDEMYNEALIAIEDLCIVIANLPLSNFGMNSPNRTASDLMNTEMNRELQYSTVEMAAIVARNVPLMNEEQRTIYDRIMLAVSAGQGADVTPKFLFFALHPQRSLAARAVGAPPTRGRGGAEVARENGRGGRHSGNVYIQRALTPLMKLANGGSAEHRCGCRKKKTDGHSVGESLN
ncbi:hypothetical protein EVAR_80744_1 [Eumeta japonica]|uniref:Uncharacterized protein n=1 Tax=Eumeta variegata TaxID=151549 RepID=A0A4C1XAW0_EUMVA|nr:hypothetical protein EVAR_80744_1 [Eumeta japonica]